MKNPGVLCASLREEEKALLERILKEKSTTAPDSRGKICSDCYQLLEIAEVGRSTFESHMEALEMKQKRERANTNLFPILQKHLHIFARVVLPLELKQLARVDPGFNWNLKSNSDSAVETLTTGARHAWRVIHSKLTVSATSVWQIIQTLSGGDVSSACLYL